MTSYPIRFDPLSPEQLADPYPLYARLRREAPVFYSEAHGLWVVSRYEDVLAVVRDTETFSSQNAVRASVRPLPQPVLDVLATGRPMAPTLTDSDGQVHRRLRLLVSKAFTPKRVAELEGRIRENVDALIDEFAGDGRADIIERFAWNLPMFTLTDMIGIPRDDIPTLHRWSVSWLRILQATDGVEELVTRAHDVVAMQRYFMDALQSRVGKAGEDLMSSLLDARVADGEPIGHEEAMRVTINLLIAGHVTVTRSIGNGLTTLLAHSDQLQAVLNDPDLVPAMVEEILRFESPAQGLFRTVRKDTVLNDVPIPAGAHLMVHWASANRDERVFGESDVFDVTRDSMATHVAFGKGVHACLGAPLARLQLKIALPRLFERLPNLRMAAGEDTAVRDTIFFARGFKRLEIEWDVKDS